MRRDTFILLFLAILGLAIVAIGFFILLNPPSYDIFRLDFSKVAAQFLALPFFLLGLPVALTAFSLLLAGFAVKPLEAWSK